MNDTYVCYACTYVMYVRCARMLCVYAGYVRTHGMYGCTLWMYVCYARYIKFVCINECYAR